MWAFWMLTGGKNLIMRQHNTTSCHRLRCERGRLTSSILCKTQSVVSVNTRFSFLNLWSSFSLELTISLQAYRIFHEHVTLSSERVSRWHRCHADWTLSNSRSPRVAWTWTWSFESIDAKNDGFCYWRRWMAGGPHGKRRPRAKTTKINQVSCRPQKTKWYLLNKNACLLENPPGSGCSRLRSPPRMGTTPPRGLNNLRRRREPLVLCSCRWCVDAVLHWPPLKQEKKPLRDV